MRNRLLLTTAIFLMSGFTSAIMGCGQKGPLILPSETIELPVTTTTEQT